MFRLIAFIFFAVSLAHAQEIVSKYVKEVPLDPLSSTWQKAKEVEVDLTGQLVTPPMHPSPSVTKIKVRSLNDGKSIGFLLIWNDKTEDRFHLINKFSDAVAVQIPYSPSSDYQITMGDKNQRVLILHWSAFRQENIERGYADVSKIYPNTTYDWYPHAVPPYKYPQDWSNQYALDYLGGERVFKKNTFSTPVREIVAEGYGSSTWKDIQGAQGKGVYKNGKWYVVIRREFLEPNTSNPEWGPNRETFVTFAVWDGSNGEVGARKSLSYSWIKLKIEGK